MNDLEQQIANLLNEYTLATGESIADVVAIGEMTSAGMRYRVRAKPSLFDDRRAVAGDVWIRAFLRDQGINADLVRRVVIDGRMNEALRVCVEYLGRAEAIQFQPFDLTVADVVEVGKSSGRHQ